ncbi:SurA N-terminal domain-containing protein [Methylobrevis albus]|uniref:SurA N-terminal domain-containing protein n=1 Tax=Methylobrevis albus TaxID=2793297 RepID=A0A931I5K6_9HYPH|nr:SurA N-terminal domain-containing protein [Methylobrevis albus]MBH0239701.1 SurA N-terminal domain-containing protein [Methylobrevis albus]
MIFASVARSILRRCSVAVIAVAVAAPLLGAAPVFAQSGIRVVVNDSAVTSFEIAQRARLIEVSQRLSGAAAQKAATDELIDDTLRLQEMKRVGIAVPDAQVDSAIAEIAGRSKMSPAQFTQALGQVGVNIKTLRERIRVQIGWGRLIRARLQQTVRQERNDLIAQMRREENAGIDVTAEDFVLQRVIFTLRKGAPDAEISRRRQEAEQLRGRFTSCDAGLATAKTLREVAVLNVGRRLAGELPENIAALVKETDVGRLTKPVVTPQGVELYAVCGKQTVTGEAAVTAGGMDADQLNAQGQQLSQTMMRQLRQRASITMR